MSNSEGAESGGGASHYATEITDLPVGETTTISFSEDGAEHDAAVVEREAYVPATDWPEIGETVTFKAVNGPVEKDVADIDKSRDHPIQVGHGGWYERSNFEEYTKVERHKVLELPSGKEIWASPEEAEA